MDASPSSDPARPPVLAAARDRTGGQTRTRVQEYTSPYEVTDKDLTPLYGRYQIYEVVEHRGGLTPADEAQAWVGKEMVVAASLLKLLGDRIENPVYEVWFYPAQLPSPQRPFDPVRLGTQNLFDMYPTKSKYAGRHGMKYPVVSPYGYNGGLYYLRASYSF